jgi:hypothetical protein
MLKNRSEKMKNIKVQIIKNANESLSQRISKISGSVDFKKFNKDYDQFHTKIKSDRSKQTPMNKKKEISPFDRKVSYVLLI